MVNYLSECFNQESQPMRLFELHLNIVASAIVRIIMKRFEHLRFKGAFTLALLVRTQVHLTSEIGAFGCERCFSFFDQSL